MKQPDLVNMIKDEGFKTGVIQCIDDVFKEGYSTVSVIPVKVSLPSPEVLEANILATSEEDREAVLKNISIFEDDPCRFLGVIISQTRQLLNKYDLNHLMTHREVFGDAMIRIRSAFNFSYDWKTGDDVDFCLIVGADLKTPHEERFDFAIKDFVAIKTALILGLNKVLMQYDETALGVQPDSGIFDWVKNLFEEGPIQVFYSKKNENVTVH